MKRIYDVINSKLAKIIITSVIGFFFLCSLISTIVSWNGSLSLSSELITSLTFFECFVSEATSMHGNTPPTTIDYANAHVHLSFNVTLIFGLLLAFSLLNIFLRYVDHDYVIRGSLSLGCTLTLILVNLQLAEPIKYRYFGVATGIFLAFVSLFYFSLFILNKICVKTPWKVYLIHAAALFVPIIVFPLLAGTISAIKDQTIVALFDYLLITVYPYALYRFVAVVYFWSNSGIYYIIAPLPFAMCIIYLDFLITGIISSVVLIVQAIRKKEGFKKQTIVFI